ncbi:MAG: hypothetical protein AAGE65_04835 [Planctomycetota bacterium]
MPESRLNHTAWLTLLEAVEPSLDTDPAALGRAIGRWATLAAAAHRVEDLPFKPGEARETSTLAEARR